MKKYVILMAALMSGMQFLSAQVGTQDVFTDPEYKYFVGTSDPGIGWNTLNYRDSAWIKGRGSIGYGDGDDSVTIDTTTSVYIRYYFPSISNEIPKIKAMVIFADFDDGFIAYLNGHEIVRVNMADSIAQPTNMQTACRSHEAEGYRFPHPAGWWVYNPMYGYYIDSATLAQCNLKTAAVLAFEVHNDSIKGSDLSFNFSFEFIYDDFNYSFESGFGRFRAIVPVDSSPLPILKIETNEFGIDTTSVMANLGIISNQSGRYNKPDDPFTDYNGRIRIKIHGAASRMYPKKSYKIETEDSTGANNNVSLLGMPPENDWMLISEYSDKCLINDRLTYDLGRATGEYAPRSRYCEVILNGIDQGIYCLNEQIKRDKNRVDIAKLKPGDSTGVDLTGGYIFRIGGDAYPIEVLYPKSDSITQNQDRYIHDLFDSCSKALAGNYVLNPERGYKKYLDLNALANYMIVTELSKNEDAYAGSFYFHKDKDDVSDKIFLGPLWDYDNAYGTGVWNIPDYTGWSYYGGSPAFKIASVMKDTTFRRLFADKWFGYRKGIFALDSLYDRIDNQVDEMGTAVERNYRIWQELPYIFHPDKLDKDSINTYAGNIERLKTWIANRVDWIDRNALKLYPDYTGIPLTDLNGKNETLVACYPNPFSSELTVLLNLERPGDIQFEILDITGRKCRIYSKGWLGAGETKFQLDGMQSLKSGFYILNVFRNGKLTGSSKIIKME